MTALDPRLEEIEARLSKATPGPWVVRSTRATEWAPYYGVTAAENKHRYIVPAAVDWEGFGHGAKEADAEFIAAAPADIAYLLAELRKSRLRTQRVAVMGTRYLAELRKAQDKLARVEGVAKYLDRLAPGDKHYAGLIRAAVADAKGDERG